MCEERYCVDILSPARRLSFSTAFPSVSSDVNGDLFMDVMIAAYAGDYLEAGAVHIVYGTNTSAAYEASFLDVGVASNGEGLDGNDGITLSGSRMEAVLYATLVSGTRAFRNHPVAPTLSVPYGTRSFV